MIYQHHLRALAIEMCKISIGLSLPFMMEMMNEIDIPYYTGRHARLLSSLIVTSQTSNKIELLIFQSKYN